MVKCPHCSLEVNELFPVDQQLVERIQRNDPGALIHSEVCKPCLQEMRKSSHSVGGSLLAEAKAKENHKLNLWKSRVQLIKKGRTLMEQKMFSDAAVEYEKYIKLMEIVFDCQKGELKPDLFKERARHQELTVICSVYWDLLRIYDTSEAYAQRQVIAAEQLAKFLPFTPIFPDIIKKAETFSKGAKNPAVIKSFIRQALRQRPRCFIATSAFEYPHADEVLLLRAFRDGFLRQQKWGRQFIRVYYRYSPKAACLLDKQPWLKPAVRACLRLLIKCVR